MRSFHSRTATLRWYPGSPQIAAQMLREGDHLRMFELHPTEIKLLEGHFASVKRGVSIQCADGFSNLKGCLPPPPRRGLVHIDPPYEAKEDYKRVLQTLKDSIPRFTTGTYAVWYPIIPRPEAHDLPKKLKTLANKSGKAWLHATLTVKSSKLTQDEQGEVVRPGLPASGMFLINPPHTLKAALKDALPQMVELLGQDSNAAFSLESGGG